MELMVDTTLPPSPVPNWGKDMLYQLTDGVLSTQLPPTGTSPPTPNFFQKYAEKYLKTRQFSLTGPNYKNYLGSTE